MIFFTTTNKPTLEAESANTNFSLISIFSNYYIFDLLFFLELGEFCLKKTITTTIGLIANSTDTYVYQLAHFDEYILFNKYTQQI